MKTHTLLLLSAVLASPVLGSEHAQPVALSELTHIHGVVLPAGSDTILLATHHGLYSVDPAGNTTMVSAEPDDFMGFTAATDGRLFASGHPATGGNIGVIGAANADGAWRHLSDGQNGPVDFHAMSVSPADGQTLYGSFRGIQVSRDGGGTWEVSGPGPAELIDLAAAPDAPGHVYAGTMAGLFESEDFGRTWSEVTAAGGPVTALETRADGNLYAFVAGRGLMRLEAEELVAVGEVTDMVLLHLGFDPDDQNRVVAVTTESAVLSSLDGGKSWSPLAP
ncbi:WD40/YVTN/BNR-like repeat-containing protein [Devosia soli]|uniref:WD40/YVTN/BNR-like repeat-containing protein n=1 Tax=Devosia soli TaxID=361041 RepID=UPI00069B0D89|nr:hypothetical protein [Devosia soli]